MDQHFLDFEDSKMLRILGFNQLCYDAFILSTGEKRNPSSFDHAADFNHVVYIDSCSRPTYGQVKIWLWEKHKMVVCVDINRNKENHCCIRNETMDIIIPADILSENWKPDFYDSPITAEIEAIKKVIQELYKQKKIS